MKTLQSLIAVSLLTVCAASQASIMKPSEIEKPHGPTVVQEHIKVSLFDKFDVDGQYPTNPLKHLIHDVVYGHHPLVDTTPAVSAVPLPAAVWLFGAGLIGLVGVARRKA